MNQWETLEARGGIKKGDNSEENPEGEEKVEERRQRPSDGRENPQKAMKEGEVSGRGETPEAGNKS